MLLLATIKGWSLAQLHRQLSAYHLSYWRRLLKVRYHQVPAYSTLVDRARNARVMIWQNRLYRRVLVGLLHQRNLGVLALDMTDLPRRVWDPLASWGFCGKGGFYGYKLHLVVAADGVPLAATTTQARNRETEVVPHLLRQLHAQLRTKALDGLRFAVADAAYDTHDVHAAFAQVHTQLITPVNPRKYHWKLTWRTRRQLQPQQRPRDRGILLYHSRRGQKLHRKRRVVDYVFGQLKDQLRLKQMAWWIRGVRRVQIHIQWTILAYTAMLATNRVRRCGLRKLAPYLA